MISDLSACRSGAELLREVKQRWPDTQRIHPRRLFADIGVVIEGHRRGRRFRSLLPKTVELLRPTCG